MKALLLSPHNDDAVLFASWALLRYRPHVVTVFRSVKQTAYGITAEEREAEDAEAFQILGVTHEQWTYPDTEPLPADARGTLAFLRQGFDHCFAPAVEAEDGHEQHDEVGRLAQEVFGPGNVTGYLTYRRHQGKSRWGVEVPYEPAWVGLKLRTLACYRSQIETVQARCTVHFAADLAEYVTS